MNNLHFALRLLFKRPGFTWVAAFSLALGIGLVATQFSLIDGILLRGLPVPEAQRLARISRVNPQTSDRSFWASLPYRDYLALRDGQTTVESLAAVNTSGGLNLSGPGRTPTHHAGALASANLPEVLGVHPMLGRWFTADEDRPGQPLRIVLSQSRWQEQFGGSPDALGRSVNVYGEPGTIIGVMPPRFTFSGMEQLWVNLRAAPGDPRLLLADRVELVGRLRPGVTFAQARVEFDALAAGLAKPWPETNQGYERMNVQRIATAYAGGGTQPIRYLMPAMAVLILVRRQGGRQIATGLGGGLPAGFFLTRPFENLFGSAMANNALIYLLVAVVITLVGLFAAWLPAHRATKVDPMVALRTE